MGIEFIKNHKLVNIQTREEGEYILRKLDEIAEEYNSIYVSDVKDLVGIECRFLDSCWRWTDSEFKSAQLLRDRYDYEIVFPFPKFYDPKDKNEIYNKKPKPLYPSEKSPTDYIDPIHITIHTSSVDDPAGVTEEVFRYANTIKDRTVKIDIR